MAASPRHLTGMGLWDFLFSLKLVLEESPCPGRAGGQDTRMPPREGSSVTTIPCGVALGANGPGPHLTLHLGAQGLWVHCFCTRCLLSLVLTTQRGFGEPQHKHLWPLGGAQGPLFPGLPPSADPQRNQGWWSKPRMSLRVRSGRGSKASCVHPLLCPQAAPGRKGVGRWGHASCVKTRASSPRLCEPKA